MPRPTKGARLYLRAAHERNGKRKPARWVILDGSSEIGTGFGIGARASAEKAFADYLASKYQAPRRERPISEIRVADVIAVYLADVVPGLARPHKAAERAERLLTWWGERTLADVTGATCRAYAADREGQGPNVPGCSSRAAPPPASATRGATFRTFPPRSATITGKACTGKSSASCYRLAARRASDGSRATKPQPCCGRAGAREKSKRARRRPSARYATFAVSCCWGFIPGADRGRF